MFEQASASTLPQKGLHWNGLLISSWKKWVCTGIGKTLVSLLLLQSLPHRITWKKRAFPPGFGILHFLLLVWGFFNNKILYSHLPVGIPWSTLIWVYLRDDALVRENAINTSWSPAGTKQRKPHGNCCCLAGQRGTMPPAPVPEAIVHHY